MPAVPHNLRWQVEYGGVPFDCSLDLIVHPANSKTVFLTIAGLDGSADGYENKYTKIVEDAQARHGVAAVRVSNPFQSALSLEGNIREALAYTLEHAKEISGGQLEEIYIMGHSLGGTTAAAVAWEYPEITKLLLVNPVPTLSDKPILDSLREFTHGQTIIMYGEHDPSAGYWREQRKATSISTIEVSGADHHFSGNSFRVFMEAAQLHLFHE